MTPSRSIFWRTSSQVLFLGGIAFFYYYFLYRTPITTVEANTKNLDAIAVVPYVEDIKTAGAIAADVPNQTHSAVTFSSFHGKVQFIHIWASWCTSCRSEMPILRTLRDRFPPSRLRMIGVATQDEPSDVGAFLRSTHFPLEVFLDPRGEAARSLSIKSIPQSVLVDQNGFLRLRIEGALRESHFETISKMLTDLGV